MKTENNPLVSVAIITYNQKDFLRECIESVLLQDYANIEIVVADDGSTDGTHAILREYEKSHSGKFVLKLSGSNQGITSNSNLAHFACSGKYVAWMGGDDLMLPQKISSQVLYMENNPECTICYHDLDVFDSDSGRILHLFSQKNKPRQGDARTAIKYGCFNGACSTMVRRSKTPVHGFNDSLPVASDWCYWIESLINGGLIGYIPQVLGKYRRHSANVTNNDSKAIRQNSLDHLNTCNYIIANYPMFFNEAISAYVRNIRGLRKKVPYGKALTFIIRNDIDLKSIGAFAIYFCTMGKVRL